jgi:hypothetical protein
MFGYTMFESQNGQFQFEAFTANPTNSLAAYHVWPLWWGIIYLIITITVYNNVVIYLLLDCRLNNDWRQTWVLELEIKTRQELLVEAMGAWSISFSIFPSVFECIAKHPPKTWTTSRQSNSKNPYATLLQLLCVWPTKILTQYSDILQTNNPKWPYLHERIVPDFWLFIEVFE